MRDENVVPEKLLQGLQESRRRGSIQVTMPILPLFRPLEEPVRKSSEISTDPKSSPVKESLPDLSEYVGWVPSRDSVTVAGREIGGMIYIGEQANQSVYGKIKSRAYIDPSLPVAKAGADKDGKSLPNLPAYWELPATLRATYLDWLATGRSDTSYSARYMLLFIYGLARRFALDNPPAAERREILDEALRLKDLYREDIFVPPELDEFIQFGKIAMGDVSHIEPIYENNGWELPLPLKVAVGARLAHREPLSADWALSWFLCHPDSRLRVPAERCRDEFIALFKLRYDRRFPKGLRVKPPRKLLYCHYRPAPDEPLVHLQVKFKGKPVHDISRLRKAVEIAQEIANEAMNDLDKLSRFLVRSPERRGSLVARALMPKELWRLFPCEKLEQLRIWARRIAENGGLVPVGELVARTDGAHPDKITKKQLSVATAALGQIGFGFSPFPQFIMRSQKIGEPVVIFDMGEAVARSEYTSETYQMAFVISALGAFVAHADGIITGSERESLREKVNLTDDLSEKERRRLLADVDWMMSVPPSLSPFRRDMKLAMPEEVQALRTALIDVAHADGVVQPQEVTAIEKIYRVLELDPAIAYSDLHAGNINDGFAQMRSAGFAAPSDRIQLDPERISSIHSDTGQASSVLAEIFDDTVDDSKSEETKEMLVPGLDAAHAAFVMEIIGKDHWTEEQYQALCIRYSLLRSGATEIINEWAFETYGDALLDEHDGYEVNSAIAGELETAFEGKGSEAHAESA